MTSTLLLGCSRETNSKTNAPDLNYTDESKDTEIEESVCYDTAEEFETALNSDCDVSGAMVTFTSGITEAGPGGYYMHAGKKLIFVSNNHPNIDPGSTVTVKVKSVKNVEGTWNIEYER